MHIVGIRLMFVDYQYIYIYLNSLHSGCMLLVIVFFLLVCCFGLSDNRMFLLMFSWFDVCRCFSWLNVSFLILWALSKLSVFG